MCFDQNDPRLAGRVSGRKVYPLLLQFNYPNNIILSKRPYSSCVAHCLHEGPFSMTGKVIGHFDSLVKPSREPTSFRYFYKPKKCRIGLRSGQSRVAFIQRFLAQRRLT